MTVLLAPLTFVLERRIDQPLPDVEAATRHIARDGVALDLGGGALVFNRAFRSEADPWYPSSHASGVLVTSRGRRVARVELSLAPWSDGVTRLELRPVARHPERWTARRLRRYFHLAHDGADAVVRHARASRSAAESHAGLPARV